MFNSLCTDAVIRFEFPEHFPFRSITLYFEQFYSVQLPETIPCLHDAVMSTPFNVSKQAHEPILELLLTQYSQLQ